ncbi:Bifunctional protein FolD [archaeon GW2011_AR15]|nr:Bifunctional protein FolD [archaeon GW2011_AR15]MBS3103597.1 bifunctional 5,10-methylenetetrahydrofolate dehydrogenase/5,10-methenyltetrahydrofolate cyclohydrolase [Candidatus Woesearchaeota archaeon]
MKLLDGMKVSEGISTNLAKITGKLNLKLSIILVGKNPSSVVYVNAKKRKCNTLDIECDVVHFDNDVKEKKILEKIELLNNDRMVSGILVQLPLPSHLDTRKILDSVDIGKDVDGLNSYYLTKIFLNEEKIVPCTPKGVITLLDYYKINLYGKRICILGFSNIVGKPLAAMCINRGGTVTICNSKTKNIKEHTLRSDIIMSSVGKPKLVTKNMVSDGAIVVDIGFSKIKGKTYGDVDFNNVKEKCAYISPVPGGVGPMTIVSLIQNLILLKKLKDNF